MRNQRVFELVNEHHTKYSGQCKYVIIRDGLVMVVPTKAMARATYKKMRAVDAALLMEGVAPSMIDIEKYDDDFDAKYKINEMAFYSDYACRLNSVLTEAESKKSSLDKSVLMVADSKENLQYGLIVVVDQMGVPRPSFSKEGSKEECAVYLDMAIGDKRLVSPMHINYINQDKKSVSCGIVDNLEDTKRILESM